MYRALYRKWRPKTFSDVVGQVGITAALQNQIIHGKIGHAYLFTGTRGTGKTSCAKIFAKAVNCPHRNGADPCCECDICKGIDNGSIMDVVEIDAASNNGVDNIRDLRDETAYTPSQCTYKVYIIDEVHMLSTAAFNALLKIMEEPPAHVIFILATTEIHKVPATILSRCQRYDFMRIKPQDIEARLLYVAGQEGIQLAKDAAELISRLADGAMRDALSILDTCAGVGGEVTQQLVRRMAGVTDKGYLFDISDAVLRADAAGVLALVAQLREKSVDVKRLCDELILHYRNLLLAGVPGGQELLMGTSAEEQARYEQAARSVSPQAAVRAVKVLSDALDKMGKGTDARIELELALFNLCQPQEMRAAQPATPAPRPQPASVPQQEAVRPFTAAATPIIPAVPTQAMAETQAPVQAPAGQKAGAEDTPPWEGAASKEAAPSAVPPPAQAQKPMPEPEQLAEQEPPAEAPLHAPEQAPLSEPSPSPEKAAPVSQAPAAKPAARAGAPGELAPFAQWPQIVAAMQEKDQLLYANMKDTKAYFDGRRVWIDGTELFLEFMRRNEYSSGLIKDVIEQVSGKRYLIGPYQKAGKKAAAAAPTAQQTLEALAQLGVQVEYEDEQKGKKPL
ncbi:MAG: DNA polymerase III subunit gamma/tau [Oscillospiraceae bacterium]|nr:MAG: DNA polymerase III subunit gamma/tau [Oscillospiraceae bacterium]